MLSNSKHGVGFITRNEENENGNWTISGDGRIKSHESWDISSTCLTMEVEYESLKMMGYSGWDSEAMSSDMFKVERVGTGTNSGFKLSVSRKSSGNNNIHLFKFF